MTFQTQTAPRRLIRLHSVGQFSFELPETLPGTVAELNALLDSARADIRVIQARHAAGETLSNDDAARLKTLLAGRKKVQAAIEQLTASDAEIQGLLAEASEEGGTAAEAAVAEAPPVPPGEAPSVEDQAAATAGGDGSTAPTTETAPVAATEVAPVAAAAPPVTTGAERPVSFANAGADSPPSALETGASGGWQMLPGAPGYTAAHANTKVGFKDISLALETMRPGSRVGFQPNRQPKRVDGREYARQVISTLQREVPLIENEHALVAAINEATRYVKGQRVTAEALTAAGGWCAPSEQLYDFCDVPEATDLLSLPEITINRGGIRWPREPDLSGIFEDFEWFFTETELEATDEDGNPTAIKECVEIPCADQFDEIRLNAVGWCVEAGILQEQGWPELVEWFMRNLTQEHLRALSRRSILNVVSGSGSALVIPPTSVLGSVPSVLNSLALMATNIRLKRGLSRTATIEGIAPSWFFEVLRADLAMREGSGSDVFAVSDSQILSWLTARNIALQFVGDWQTRATGLPGNLNTLTWPGTVDVVLYPAGTWFRSMSSVIELGVMYPKEQLQVNRFTRMFTEDAIAVGKRCGESVLTRIPLVVSGAVGGRVTLSGDPGNKTNTVTVSATSGTWSAHFSANPTVETAALAEAITAADLKTALAGLDDDFLAADFTVTGSAGGPFTVVYPAELGSLVATSIDLAGGGASVTVS